MHAVDKNWTSNKWTLKKAIYRTRSVETYIRFILPSLFPRFLMANSLVTTSLPISMLPISRLFSMRVTATHFRPIRSSKEIAGSGLTQGGNPHRRIYSARVTYTYLIDAFSVCFWLTNFEALFLLLLRGRSWRWIIVKPSGVARVSEVASSNLSLALTGDIRPEKSRERRKIRNSSATYWYIIATFFFSFISARVGKPPKLDMIV